MMSRIITLDQNMINMIAAGEVIERPASVVKELMENSIDAGATRITVSVEDGGRKLISVADNGCGMDAEDLANAFEQHTTSKVKTPQDLEGISTLGFRGEALASIASVAQLRAVSRLKNSPGAHCVEIDCGNKGAVSPESADYGTTIQVRDLFYKLPARYKFLKTANTEMTHIVEHFKHIALANCSLDMTLIHNGRELYRLTGRDILARRVAELFPPEVSDNLIEAESQEPSLRKGGNGLYVFALLGKPSASRANNKFQYVFLNGRFIRDKFIQHAVKEAYRGFIEPNRFPVVFLFIRIPYEDVDVNVHPRKIDVRFYNANLVHSQILGCLREKLLGTGFDVDAKIPAAPKSARLNRSDKITDAVADFFKKHKPVQSQQQFRLGTGSLRRQGKCGIKNEGYQGPQLEAKFIQIRDSFIVAQTDDGFIIIDQHALHERIMYENLCRKIRKDKLQSQKMLVPETFELTAAQADAIKVNTELIEKLGIEFVPFGPQTMAVQSFPVLLTGVKPLEFVRDLLDLLDRQGMEPGAENLLDEVLKMTACKAAIKAGQRLTDGEIEQLLADRENLESPGRCPHGRPTTIKFSVAELERQFKRT